MTRLINICLFDMDAVLLYPGGYRAALNATVNHFSVAMGRGRITLAPEEIEAFEAAGITSEWDSAPICIAALMLERASRPDFRSLAARVSAEVRPGEYAAEAAYRVLLHEHHGSIDLEQSLAELLLNTRDIRRSPVLSVFQQYTLGPAFEATYGLPRTIEAEAALLAYDRPALTRRIPERSAIYTARPSKPPRDVPDRKGYAPEAELGAQLVGLGHVPLIGYGSVHWLAEAVGGNPEGYLKPSPVHGLAAIGAALGGSESEALLAAAAGRGDSSAPVWPPPLNALRGREGRVIVFEDSAAGIRGVRRAAALLGSGWQCVGIGIAGGGPKADALAQVADRIFPSIDDAIAFADAHLL